MFFYDQKVVLKALFLEESFPINRLPMIAVSNELNNESLWLSCPLSSFLVWRQAILGRRVVAPWHALISLNPWNRDDFHRAVYKKISLPFGLCGLEKMERPQRASSISNTELDWLIYMVWLHIMWCPVTLFLAVPLGVAEWFKQSRCRDVTELPVHRGGCCESHASFQSGGMPQTHSDMQKVASFLSR